MKFDIEIADLKDQKLEHSTYVQILKLRRDVFITEMGWNLYQHMGCEFDEYDTPASVHVAAMRQGRVFACMRLMRTDNIQGSTTYMILDAHKGRIPNLPTGLLENEIQSDTVWEASRMAISAGIEPRSRNDVLMQLMSGGIEYVRSRGGASLIGLMNPAFERVFNRKGLSAYRIGPVLDQRDGRVCVLQLDVPPISGVTANPKDLLFGSHEARC